MEEIIVVRAVDSDGTIFQTIMAALHDKSVQTVEASSSILSFGDVEIYPAFRRVLKAGKEIHLNHGEYSMLYCLAKVLGRYLQEISSMLRLGTQSSILAPIQWRIQFAVCGASWNQTPGIHSILKQ